MSQVELQQQSSSSAAAAASASKDALRKEIRQSLEEAGLAKVAPEILSQCVAIVASLNLSPKQFGVCWEALSLNRNFRDLNDRTLPIFKAELYKEADHNQQRPGSSSKNANSAAAAAAAAELVVSRPDLLLQTHEDRGNNKREWDEEEDARNPLVTPLPNKRLTSGTTSSSSSSLRRQSGGDGYSRVSLSPGPPPVHSHSRLPGGGGRGAGDGGGGGGDNGELGADSERSSTSTSSPLKRSDPYKDRTGSGKVTCTYNPHKLEALNADEAMLERRKQQQQQHQRPACSVEYKCYADTNVMGPYRHMFTTLPERSGALDAHLVRIGSRMQRKYGIASADGPKEGGYDDDDDDSKAMESHANESLSQGKADSGNKENSNDSSQSSTTTNDSSSSSNSATSSSPGIAPLEAVGVPRQQEICCIGRICNAAHEGRINDTTILLEGSRDTSGGQRIQVDLSYLKANKIAYSLFPGQVVAIQGMNPTGSKLVAHQICEGAALDPPHSSVSDLWRYHHDEACQNSMPLRIVTASGPFTTVDNLEYQPLLDLMAIVQQHSPDVVVLAGPFVDLKHPILASGHAPLAFADGNADDDDDDDENSGSNEFGASYEMFFANKVATLLEELYETDPDLTTQFVLVPSLDDAVAEWVYPQPPLADRVPLGKASSIPGGEGLELGTLGLHHVEAAGRKGQRNGSFRRVHCVPNPCTLKINEVVIGVTSTDAVFHISTNETSGHLELGSRLNRICQHMLQQQSYYPMFPASLHKANLNLKEMERWSMPCQPDVLIVPSALTTFAHKVLDHTLAVNPGRLTQGRLAGTYAVMDIHPMSRERLEQAGQGGDNSVEIHHDVPNRTRIEIKRI